MPVMKCNNNKWKIGEHGKCEYDTKETAEKAYKGYLGHKYSQQLENPELSELLDIAKWAMRRGEKLAGIVKEAIDSTAISYWSDYFKQYGMMWVRPLAFKKTAQHLKPGTELDVKGEKFKVVTSFEGGGAFTYTLEKPSGETVEMTDQELNALDAKAAQKIASQYVFDTAIQVEVEDWVTLSPDAFEHALKFALEAVKPAGAIFLSVDHCFVDVDNGMKGYANCAVTFPSDAVGNDFAVTTESQLREFLDSADFPAKFVAIATPTKRTANQDLCIMEMARSNASLASMAAHFGLHASRLAKSCAEKEATGITYSPDSSYLVKIAQELLEDEPMDFEGDPLSEEGALASTPDGFKAQIKYMTQTDPAFQWVLMSPKGEVVDQGDGELFDHCVGDVKVALPQAKSDFTKAQEAEAKKEMEAKLAFVKEFGSLVTMEKLASAGDVDEYRLETKAGKTIWLSRKANVTLDSVIF